MSTKLYVGNLPFRATEDDLRELFSQAGEVESVRIITNRDTGQSRGFGFVEMATSDAARNAITMFEGKTWMERALKVNEAKPREGREEGPRGRRGGWR